MSRKIEVDTLANYYLNRAREMNEQGGASPDELTAFYLSEGASMLCEIAKSLAIIADRMDMGE